MPQSPRPMRRRNARTAYESGAERSDFGRRSGDARPRRQPESGGAAAERSPEWRAPDSERHRRPRGAPSPTAGIHALADDVHASPIRSPGVALAARAPVRPCDASSFEKPRRTAPFLVRTWRGQCHFRWKLRASAAMMRRERCGDGQRRQRPQRRRRAAQGVEDQNESGDCRAGARPLMSPGGTVARGGAQPRATGDRTPPVGRRTMARFLH